MEVITVLLSLTLVIVSALIAFKFTASRRRFSAMLDKLPGPPYFPLLGNIDILVPRHKFMTVVNEHAAKYRPIFRTWTGFSGEVHIMKAEYIEQMIGNMNHIEKSWLYSFIHPWLGQGLLTSKGSKWHKHRKMITPTFHFKILETFFEVFVEQSQVLVDKLEEEVKSSPSGFDVYPFVTRCALDIICQTAMGTEIRAQDDTQSEYVKAVYDISSLTMVRALRPWLHPTILFNLTAAGKAYSNCLRILHSFTTKVIQERKSERKKSNSHTNEEDVEEVFGKKKRMAFLDLLLEASQGDDELTDVEIREEVDTFMFEGHDTTTAGISWALFMIGLYPHVQEKVIAELDEIFQGSDRAITMRDVQEMKYLERVIKETLRLYPSVPFIMRDLNGDTECGGYMLPSGCIINIHIFHVHRDPKYFPNPEEFNPDNFLPDTVQGRHPFAYIPFSAGPRNCIGQKFAILEEKTMIASVMRKFRLRALEKREDITLISELILKPESGIKLQLTPR